MLRPTRTYSCLLLNGLSCKNFPNRNGSFRNAFCLFRVTLEHLAASAAPRIQKGLRV